VSVGNALLAEDNY